MNEANVTAPTTNTASLLENSRWSLIAFACALAPGFITVPFVVQLIGLTAFGRAGLVLAVSAPLMLVGTALSQAVIREVSWRLAKGDVSGARRAVDAALRLCLFGGSVGWVLLVTAGPRITSIVTGGDMTPSGLGSAFFIAATGWFLQQFTIVLQATAAARQDFRTVAGVTAFTALATIGSTLGLTSAVPAVEGYLGGIAAGFTLSAVAWGWVLRHDVRWRAILVADRTAELALLGFAKWQGLALLAGAFGNQIDRYTLGALAPVNVIGQYNVANRLQEAAYIGAVKGGEVLFPRFGSLSSRSVEERGRFFQTASWVVGTFSVMVLAPLVPLSDAVITLWVPEAGPGAAVLLRTLVLGGVIGCGSNVYVYYAMGSGRNAPVAFITILYSIITVALTVMLIHALGPYAAGGGLLAASVVRLAAALVLTHRDFYPHLSWTELSTSTVLPLMAGGIVATVTQTVGVGDVHGWIHFVAIYVALTGVVLLVTLLLSSLSGHGRAVIRTLIWWLRRTAAV